MKLVINYINKTADNDSLVDSVQSSHTNGAAMV